MQLLMIEIGDFGEVLQDETLRALDLTETPPVEECFKLSVHAVAGMEEIQTMHL